MIELVVMLTVILILVAIALPNYSSSVARSEQSEAKSNLAEIYVKMMNFEPLSLEGGTALDGFSRVSSLSDIGFNPPENAYYSYSFVSNPTTNHFTARAEGIAGRVVGDVWEVSEVQKVPLDVDKDRFDR